MCGLVWCALWHDSIRGIYSKCYSVLLAHTNPKTRRRQHLPNKDAVCAGGVGADAEHVVLREHLQLAHGHG